MRAGLLVGAVGAMLVAFVGPASAQIAFPDGPNRELVMQTCQACHGLELVMGRSGADAGRWADTLDEMENNGLLVSPDERAKIFDYLVTYLGPRTATASRPQ